MSDPGHVSVVEVPPPDPAPGEVLVRVAAASLCGTDRRLVARGSRPPRIPGHEAAGRREDGTPVGIHPDLGCGRCERCAEGLENRCGGRVSVGLERDGALAEYVSVPLGHAVPLGEVPLALAPLLEPLACCLRAADMLEVRPGEPAVVVGAGGMGILTLWVLRSYGARVAVVQRSPERREVAAGLGADAVLGPEDDPAGALGEAPSVAVVAAPGAEALTWALERVAPGGRVHALAGTPSGAMVDANLVHYGHLSLVGSTGSTVGDYVRARDLVASGAVPLDRLPRETVPLEGVPAALTGPSEPRILKVMVRVEEAA